LPCQAHPEACLTQPVRFVQPIPPVRFALPILPVRFALPILPVRFALPRSASMW